MSNAEPRAHTVSRVLVSTSNKTQVNTLIHEPTNSRNQQCGYTSGGAKRYIFQGLKNHLVIVNL